MTTTARETCTVHSSCSGAEPDCRTERGTAPLTARLIDSDTTVDLGLATPEQIAASDATGTAEGHILVDEAGRVVQEQEQQLARGVRRVYVA